MTEEPAAQSDSRKIKLPVSQTPAVQPFLSGIQLYNQRFVHVLRDIAAIGRRFELTLHLGRIDIDP
jgi:hypothetical protein